MSRARALLGLVAAACSTRVELILPPETEAAVVLGSQEIHLWSYADGAAPLTIDAEDAVEVLHYERPAAELFLTRDTNARLALAQTDDRLPLPPPTRVERYEVERGGFATVTGASERARGLEVDAPPCRGLEIISTHMVGNGLLAGQFIGDLALIDDLVLFTTDSRVEPFAPPRAILFRGDTSNELSLPSFVQTRGKLTPLNDGDSFLLVYTSTRAFAVLRVEQGGRVETLSHEPTEIALTPAVGYWPGGPTIYFVEQEGRALRTYDLARRALAAELRPPTLKEPCGDPAERVVMSGPEEGVVSVGGNLPFRFADGALSPVASGEQACEASYTSFASGAELIAYRVNLLGSEAGSIRWMWRADAATDWRSIPQSRLFGAAQLWQGATLVRDRVEDALLVLAHEPTRADAPPRACGRLDARRVRLFAVSETRGVALARLDVDDVPQTSTLIHFRLEP